MGSSQSTGDPSEPDDKNEYDLLEASQITRREGETAAFNIQKHRPDGGIAYQAPGYAIKVKKGNKVRIVGWGYGTITHVFNGLPADTNCATGMWESPNLQDNKTYCIVSLVWPTTRSIWVRVDGVRQLKNELLVSAVDPPQNAVLDKKPFHGQFHLPLDTLVTFVDGTRVELSSMTPVQQATINFTYSSCLIR